MKRLDKPLEKDKDQVKDEPKIKVCAAAARTNSKYGSNFHIVFMKEILCCLSQAVVQRKYILKKTTLNKYPLLILEVYLPLRQR